MYTQPHGQSGCDGSSLRAVGRIAASEDPVLFASYDEVDKCEFIKTDAPKGAWEAWSSTDDGAGLLLNAGALRAQAREVLVSAALQNLLARLQPCHLPLDHPPHTARPGGARGAPRGDGGICDGACRNDEGACGDEEACRGGQGRDDASELPRPARRQPRRSPLVSVRASLAVAEFLNTHGSC